MNWLAGALLSALVAFVFTNLDDLLTDSADHHQPIGACKQHRSRTNKTHACVIVTTIVGDQAKSCRSDAA